jgi:hypothetical protein
MREASLVASRQHMSNSHQISMTGSRPLVHYAEVEDAGAE